MATHSLSPSHVPLQHLTRANPTHLLPQAKPRTHKHPTMVAALTKQSTVEIYPKPSKIPPFETSLQTSSAPPPNQPLLVVSTNSLQYESGFLGAIPEPYEESDGEDDVSDITYLTNILSSKVYDVAIESPLEYATKLSENVGANIWLKREDLQPGSFRFELDSFDLGICKILRIDDVFVLQGGYRVFSFKLRGAYNMMAKLSRDQLKKGVICSSAGNHAQGVALAAKKLNCDAVIVMPVTTPEIKWKSVERLGATVVLIGDSYDEAQTYAKQRAVKEGRTFVPPFDHPDIIMGQGTVGMEIHRQANDPLHAIDSLHAIFVPVGGGGLIAGIAAFVKQVSPEVKIIGVEPADANAMALSLHLGQRVMLEQVGGFADGVAVKTVGEETFRLCRKWVDGVVFVNRDAICASIKNMFEEKRSILEPAGALALAGAEAYCKYYGLKDENVVAITTGANMNFDRLRLVTELANVGRQREAVLATFMPETPGSFKRFCELVGPMNITEFKYRYDGCQKEAVVLYSVGLHKPSELAAMVNRMESSQLRTLNFTTNDLVKDHLRHLMGGQSNLEDEVIFRFVFPERPGALNKFLNAFCPLWNISLFHYRSQGESGANVLVGIQVASSEMDEFRSCANSLGFDYTDESDNAAFRLLMENYQK
ncbi:hypothetical protein GIB67_021312 [Kingdonia uniflora]|uniref:Threonine dehydratase n=1 Tax=Kingdonia uniflora TaxID=39325 RepID=A0A7J7LXW3_9MAGN|nr:hypothetical protein GIB67_021312 [Kingdonia uniflora]